MYGKQKTPHPLMGREAKASRCHSRSRALTRSTHSAGTVGALRTLYTQRPDNGGVPGGYYFINAKGKR
jgi:hypothetical protein